MDETGKTPAPSEKPAKERVVFSAHDWLALALALGLAALYRNVFFFQSVVMAPVSSAWSPGLGVTVFVFALFAAVFIVLGKKIVFTPQSGLLTFSVLLLSLCCFLFANRAMTVINCFVILGGGAMAIFSLSGALRRTWRQAAVVWETVALSFIALFSNVPKPFQALSGLGGNKKSLAGVIAGAVICLPVLLIVVSLLASADAVFASLFERLFEWFREVGVWSIVWGIAKTLALMLFFFSALYFLRHPRESAAPETNSSLASASATPAVSALLLLDIVYAVFVFIQIKYLFGGESAAVIRGGYAEYARSGFFQLVAVAAINLAAVLITSTLCLQNGGAKTTAKGRASLRAFSSLLLFFTAVILASALYRMCLYISVYGLSVLRVLTLWGMAVILVGIIAVGIKLVKPDFKFFQVFFAFALASWIALNLLNVDASIAKYNVDSYLDGSVEQIDVEYLTSLSPDVFPALERLYEHSPESFGTSLPKLKSEVETPAAWSTWKLSYRHLK